MNRIFIDEDCKKSYSIEFLINYAKRNKKQLLKVHSINDNKKLIVIANYNGWCTVYSCNSKRIFHEWACNLVPLSPEKN